MEIGALLELVPHFLLIYSYRICTFVYFVIFTILSFSFLYFFISFYSISIYFKSEVPILKVSQYLSYNNLFLGGQVDFEELNLGQILTMIH